MLIYITSRWVYDSNKKQCSYIENIRTEESKPMFNLIENNMPAEANYFAYDNIPETVRFRCEKIDENAAIPLGIVIRCIKYATIGDDNNIKEYFEKQYKYKDNPIIDMSEL